MLHISTYLNAFVAQSLALQWPQPLWGPGLKFRAPSSKERAARAAAADAFLAALRAAAASDAARALSMELPRHLGQHQDHEALAHQPAVVSGYP